MTDFNYKKYSLEQLDNWLHDAVNCEDISPQELYDTIVKVVSEDIDYHEKYYRKSLELLNLLGGYSHTDCSGNEPYDGWENSEEPIICSSDNSSPECKKNWQEFWEGHDEPYYTEEELDAMCERAATEELKKECKERNRKYNLREVAYYDKRAELDAAYEAIKEAGGYEWTP